MNQKTDQQKKKKLCKYFFKTFIEHFLQQQSKDCM